MPNSNCLNIKYRKQIIFPHIFYNFNFQNWNKRKKIIFIIIIVIGATSDLKSVWAIADTFNGLMAIPNLIGVILLSPIVITMVKKYLKNPISVELEK